MAARSRITVLLLLFLLLTEHSFAVTEDELTPLVNKLLSKYPVKNMFSLAVSIPWNQNQNQNQDQNQNKNKNQNQGANRDIDEVLIKNRADDVENQINMKKVYVGYRMVAARPLWQKNYVKNRKYTDHAESRVVDGLTQLYKSPPVNKNDLLLFYVSSSPCDHKCTNEENEGKILERIKDIKKWKDHAFVFSKMFQPSDGSVIPETKHRDSLERLGEQIGLKNIFRCDRDQNQQMKCVSCSSNGQVAQTCVSNGPPSASSNTGPQTGRGASSSQGGAQANRNPGRGASSSQGGAQANRNPGRGASSSRGGAQANRNPGRGASSSQGGAQANRNPGRGASSSQGGDQDGWLTPKKGKGHRGRRDISYNTGDSSAHISESNKGAEDAPSVDENGNDVGSDEGNGSDLRTVVDVVSPHIGFDSGDGRVSFANMIT